MVNAEMILRDALKTAAEREANRIVQAWFAPVKVGAAKPTPPTAATSAARIRHRAASRRQFAPKGSWLAMGRTGNARTVSGQLASALHIAEQALASGPADRAVLTKLMVDANPGWTRVTASGCISRLVAAGRLKVSPRPNA